MHDRARAYVLASRTSHLGAGVVQNKDLLLSGMLALFPCCLLTKNGGSTVSVFIPRSRGKSPAMAAAIARAVAGAAKTSGLGPGSRAPGA